ncbi:hypothetical protein ACW9VW_08615, partial [Lactiplantibacillus plantarum]
GATDALFLFSIISKTGLEKSEDFSRPVLFLETYVTASYFLDHHLFIFIKVTVCYFNECTKLFSFLVTRR